MTGAARGPIRVAAVNLASGRDRSGTPARADALAAAVAGLDADVVAVQEVDAGQPRSHHLDQPAVLAAGLGATDWRYAATLHGTPSPGPVRGWAPCDPVRLRGPGDPVRGRTYGVALFARRPVRRWHVLGLAAGRARLPVPVPDPDTGRLRAAWFPDEPRAAIAAELDGLTVVGTHLSFAPPTAVRQLRRVRAWGSRLPGPVVVAGDLNLAGPLPAVVAGGRRLVTGPTFPASAPWVQLDHLLALAPGDLAGAAPAIRRLDVGDHLAVSASVVVGAR